MVFAVALFGAIVLVPLGLVYGVISRVLLLRRQWSARRNVPAAVDGRALQASAGITGLQVVDRWIAAGLAVVGTYLLLLSVVSDRLEAQGFVFGNTTGVGSWLLVAGGIGFLGVVLLLVAIPVSAVVTTRRIRDREVLLGEAFALARRGGRPRRIRRQRALSSVVFLAYAVAAVVLTVSTAPVLLPR